MNAQQTTSLGRRSFMWGVGGGVAAGLASASQTAQAIGGGTDITGFFDVTKPPYNAPATGSSNAQPGIQAAITAAAVNGGGIVWLPPGVYRLDSQVTVPSQVILAGAGWTTPPPDAVGSPNNNTGNGSWISITSAAFTPIKISGSGASVRDVAFIHQQATSISTGWAPVNYPDTIEVNGSDVALENIFFRNASRGIIIRGAVGQANSSTGRVTLKHIWGQPIISGVSVDNVLDVIKIDDVHFWPFWSYHQIVSDYQRYGANYAFTFKRCDNPHLTNIFVLGYRIGFYFSSSTPSVVGGSTSRFLMSNCGVDHSPQGIMIDGPGTSGAVSNFYTLGGTNGISGIEVNAANVLLQCSNIRISVVNTNAVRAAGANTVVSVENIAVDNWNQSGLGFPAIGGLSPATVYVGHSRIFMTASGPQIGTPASGDTATFVVDN